MASITDKFGKASIDTNYAQATTVKTVRSVSATVLECDDLSKWTEDTPVYFITYNKSIDPVTNAVSIINRTSWKGLVNASGNTITNLQLAPGYVDVGNNVGDYVECIPTSLWANDLVDGLNVSHNLDGSLKDNIVTTTKIADSAVTLAKMNGGTTAGALVSDSSGVVSASTITTDANGWTVETIGRRHIATKKYTGTAPATTSGNISSIVTINKPIGLPSLFNFNYWGTCANNWGEAFWLINNVMDGAYVRAVGGNVASGAYSLYLRYEWIV